MRFKGEHGEAGQAGQDVQEGLASFLMVVGMMGGGWRLRSQDDKSRISQPWEGHGVGNLVLEG